MVTLRLGDRIQGRHDQHVSIEKIAIVGAIKDGIHTDEHLTVYVDGKAALRIFGGSVTPTELDRSRSNQQQLRKVPAKRGQLIDLLGAENRGHVGTFGFQKGGLVHDVDCLRDCARLEGGVERRNGIDRDID